MLEKFATMATFFPMMGAAPIALGENSAAMGDLIYSKNVTMEIPLLEMGATQHVKQKTAEMGSSK
jgi:hypothetical protein